MHIFQLCYFLTSLVSNLEHHIKAVFKHKQIRKEFYILTKKREK